VIDKVKGNEEKIRNLINEHKMIASFNGEEFDVPILYNNDLMPEDKRYMQIDCMQILGKSVFISRSGMPFKNRGGLMGYKFKKNSLKVIAETMNLETQKGDIDYEIFFKDEWTDEEEKDIRKYLESDVKATKQMFDKLYEFWYPFTEFLSVKNILNFSWIRSSIASLRYKGDCHTLGVDETYSDDKDKQKEEMGGNVIDIKYEEARNVWYLDFGSLYPWIRNMCCIDNEVVDPEVFHDHEPWHGNDELEVKGYYDISYQSPIALKSIENLKKRAQLKKDDPTNPLIYAIKIYENAGYGAMRSPVFEQIHTPNAGWDICWLGQQIQKITSDMMAEFGFETIAGDTDSIFVILKTTKHVPTTDPQEEYCEQDYVQDCLQQVLHKIKTLVPFPTDDFKIDIEDYLDYVMWPFETKRQRGEDKKMHDITKGKKKNYLYLVGDKLKIVGLPIIKDNATKLGPKILKEVIKEKIITERHAKFDSEWMMQLIINYLDKEENLFLMAKEFKVKKSESYKLESQIQAQISRGYFEGQDGVINLIKNKRCGKAGKGSKYCTIEEAKENNLQVDDLDLTKLYNELQPFCKEKLGGKK